MSSSLVALAEAGYIVVLARGFIAPPGVVGAGDFCKVAFGEFAMHTIYERAHLAGIDEKRFAPPVSKPPVLFVAGDKPQADRDLRRIE
jgi:hypothetical protein